MTDPNKPEVTLRDGALKATIWKNEGDSGPYFSTTLARTYEDRDGNLKDTHSFTGGDLLKVAELAREAYGESRRLMREYYRALGRGQDQDQHQDRQPDQESDRERAREQHNQDRQARQQDRRPHRPR